MMSKSEVHKSNGHNLVRLLFSLLLISILVNAIAGCGSSDDNDLDTNPKTEDTDNQLEQVLTQRFAEDRTGLCVAAAYIEEENVTRATICADPTQNRLEGDTVAAEIGSVTKTMTAALLASLIEDGQLNMDDSLELHLPLTANVPNFMGQPILLKHLVTHTSGLPREPEAVMLSTSVNPYADLTEAQVIESLGSVTLDRAPGTKWAYSNFGFMLLSYVAAHTAGTNLETLMRERIFNPLGMAHTYISQPPPGTQVAVGHTTIDGQPAIPWASSVNLAGIGGVRATLNDMVRYAQAQFGLGDTRTVNTLMMTHDLIDLGVSYPPEEIQMGMAWWRGTLADRTLLQHGGNTPGFSSLVVIEPEEHRAIVILSDVNQDYGAREELAAHLLDPDNHEIPKARRVAIPDLALLESLQGRYYVDGLEVIVSYSGQTLVATLIDGTEIEFGFDSRGDFYPLLFDALVTPILDETGKQTFIWNDTDNVYIAERINP